jgi:hypothetical protein
MLKVSGGTYTDEATGATMTMSPGDAMTAVIPSFSSDATTSAVHITPLTSMAQAMAGNMAGGMTDANIAAANAAIGDHFQVSDIIHTPPMNPLAEGAGTGATRDMKNYGMTLAAMSQYAKDTGMSSSSGVVTLMMDDASDGVLDGMKGNTPIQTSANGSGPAGGGTETMLSTAGTSSLATSMEQFMESGMNKSGVDKSDMQALMNSLASSNGQLQGMGEMMNGGTGGDGMTSEGTGTCEILSGETTTGGMMNGGSGGDMISAGTGSGGTGQTDAGKR